MKRCCDSCEYWDNTKFFDKKKGLCKFDAPVFSSDNKTRWPVTRENDWCGQCRFIKNETDQKQSVRSESREYDSNRGWERNR